MRYVSRDGDGKINGDFARKQKDILEEILPDDNSELLAYKNPIKPLAEQKQDFYNSEGLTREAFIDAFMQVELDGSSTALDDYKSSRTIVRAKAEFPK